MYSKHLIMCFMITIFSNSIEFTYTPSSVAQDNLYNYGTWPIMVEYCPRRNDTDKVNILLRFALTSIPRPYGRVMRYLSGIIMIIEKYDKETRRVLL